MAGGGKGGVCGRKKPACARALVLSLRIVFLFCCNDGLELPERARAAGERAKRNS